MSKKGDPNYRHECSSLLLKTGFCIKATAGRALTKDEMLYIGTVVLTNQSLTRRLFVLGYDTLIIEDIIGEKSVKWAIKDFTRTLLKDYFNIMLERKKFTKQERKFLKSRLILTI